MRPLLCALLQRVFFGEGNGCGNLPFVRPGIASSRLVGNGKNEGGRCEGFVAGRGQESLATLERLPAEKGGVKERVPVADVSFFESPSNRRRLKFDRGARE